MKSRAAVFPVGRSTLVCGGPGCGKTVLGMEFLARGVQQFDEPGLFVSFEESRDDLLLNFQPFGWGLRDAIERERLHIVHIDLRREDLFEAGGFSLDGLLVRLQHAIARVGAQRVVVDSLETLFSHLPDSGRLRPEVARLLRCLKDQGVTSIVTTERGSGELTRHGLEEYVSDCVIALDHRVAGNISKRRLRIVKYRGSAHGMDEYPFLIGESGISVFPISSVELADVASTDIVSTGIDALDAMLGQGGFYRGSNVLVSGTPGAGKSTLGAAFAAATCKRGESCLYLAYEEPQAQIVRNMRSVGLELAPYLADGRLEIRSGRPTRFGLEEHLVSILGMVARLQPRAVIIDPITDFVSIGETDEVKSMITRVLAELKSKEITTFMTSLTDGTSTVGVTEARVSSMMDAWSSCATDWKVGTAAGG